MSETGDIVAEFLTEARERLDQIDRDVFLLVGPPADREALARIFRSIHSIKGVAGFLGFGGLEALTHAGENLLVELRDRAAPLTAARSDALIRLADGVRQSVGAISLTGSEPAGGHADLIDALARVQSGAGTPAHVGNMGEELMAQGLVTADQVQRASDRQRAGDPRRIGEILVEEAAVPPQAITAILARQSRRDASSPASRGDSAGPARRTVAIGAACGQLAPLVQDLALQCEKQVRLELHGMDIEVDSHIVESLRDALLHAARNAVDHGIERPEVRLAAGKSAAGLLEIRISRGPGVLKIEVVDDGAGIDVRRIVERAVERGLVAAGDLTPSEALSLVFVPGVSAARAVTRVSGRGMGMDVVRSQVQRLGGTADVASETGRGTTLRMVLPVQGPRAVMPTGFASSHAAGNASAGTVPDPHGPAARPAARRRGRRRPAPPH